MTQTAVPNKTWAGLVAPIVRRCKLAAALNCNAVFNPDSAQALASLVTTMAERLDTEIAFLRAQECARDVLRMQPHADLRCK